MMRKLPPFPSGDRPACDPAVMVCPFCRLPALYVEEQGIDYYIDFTRYRCYGCRFVFKVFDEEVVLTVD
jgi:hypothetical protein